MKKRFLITLLAGAVLAHGIASAAVPASFDFGVIAHSFRINSDESALKSALSQADEKPLAFVVANGVKSRNEPCSDKLYGRRRNLFEHSKNALIVSVAASDWADCKGPNGKSAAIERLNRVRDLFFADEFSFGTNKIPLIHQSTSAQFRSYAENARWEFGNILFATINLPLNNNHYLAEAGRNSEFDDRLIANRDWLQRIFTHAKRKKIEGIVLFCDANPLPIPSRTQLVALSGKHDGFGETRRLINTLSAKFKGQVLLIHGQAATGAEIDWHGNLGQLSVMQGWRQLHVSPGATALFALVHEQAGQKDEIDTPEQPQ